MAAIGQSITPADLGELTRGRGRFLADLAPANGLHAVFVRAIYAHGQVAMIDPIAAQSVDGLVAVLTADDLGLPDLVDEVEGRLDGGPATSRTFLRPVLAGTHVRFAGEAIAIVLAETAAAAADAAALVGVRIEPLPVVADADAARRGDVLLFPELGSNIVNDLDEVLGQPGPIVEWPVSVTVEVKNQRLAATPIETLGITVEPGSKPRALIRCGHQAPHELRRRLAAILGLAEDDVRVQVPRVGGAFGLKGIFHPEYAAVAAASLRLGRPVTWLADRRDELLAAAHGRGQIGRMTLSGEPGGRIRRADVEVVADLGAYPHHGGELAVSTRLMATGPYDIGHVTIRVTTVVTNRAPVGPYRGAGRPEAAYLLERAIDAYARRVGRDPADVRRANLIRKLPHTTPTGARYDSGDYVRALDDALELADEGAIRREQRQRLETGANPIGLGIGAYMDRSGGGLTDGEFARVELLGDGSAIVRTGSTATGQAHSTIWQQVVGDAFTIPPNRVVVLAGDTADVARGVGTFGSRSTQLGASAAFAAATAIVDRARTAAADRLEARPDDLELANGAFRVAGSPAVVVTLATLATALASEGRPLVDELDFVPGALTFPYGVFVAVVEVDLATGVVLVRRIAAVNDCGRLVNPRLAADQVVGSIAQGLGQAQLEALEYEDAGQLPGSTLMEYLLPLATDMPEIRLGWIETPAPSNPLGVKGIGESGCIGVPQAVVNAALDALAPSGVEDLEMPLRPDRVWAAIQRARHAPAGPTAAPTEAGMR